jgi:hypothetical protein
MVDERLESRLLAFVILSRVAVSLCEAAMKSKDLLLVRAKMNAPREIDVAGGDDTWKATSAVSSVPRKLKGSLPARISAPANISHSDSELHDCIGGNI